MDLKFKTLLERHLRDSQIALQRLMNARLLEDGLRRAMTERKIGAHQEKVNCIEKLV